MTPRPELPYRSTIPEVVRRAASLFGDGDYVVLPDRRISFRDVELLSRRLAKNLLRAGVTKGTRVGLHLPTSPEWAVAFIAVTRIGAVVMPFSTLYRPPELRTAMRIGDVSVLLSSSTMFGNDHEAFLEEVLPGLNRSAPGHLRIVEVPYLRSIRLLGGGTRRWSERFDVYGERADVVIDGFDEELFRAVEAEVSPADPSTAVFTSGTAADPKAVVHSHGAVVRKSSPVADAALTAMYRGRVLSLMPFFWIGGMQEVLSALQSGATLVALERPDSNAALELAKREAVTSIKEAMVARRSLFDGVDVASEIPTIRPLPVRSWEGGPSSTGDMARGIGMTETFGPWTNVEGMECRVVNPDTGDMCGEGEVGEFLVRGYGLMLSLYKREREEVFRPDGFYATGDLGYVEKGKYYFKSRLGDMIKTKGANVAPAEVEAVLSSMPAVRDSFVVGLPHDALGEVVAAVVVPEEHQEVEARVVVDQCRRMLSSYKVPSVVRVFRPDEIPRLASGKVDRRLLTRVLAGGRPEG